MVLNRRELLMRGVAAGAAALAPAQERRPHPNIVLFVVDDMGWQDTSVPFWGRRTPFNDRYHTPNMERLASEGMRFTDAYSGGPVCTPTRVGLMTGWSPARSHVTNWTYKRDVDPSGDHPTLAPPTWNLNGLSCTVDTPRAFCPPTLPSLLRAAGYRTIHVGKAHFGAVGTPGADPCNLGFDVNIAGHGAGSPGSYLPEERYGRPRSEEHTWDVPGLEKYHNTGTFLSEALTIEANLAIDRAVGEHRPFFLNMAHYAVHIPFAPDRRFYQRYRDAGLDHIEAMYAGLIEGMDHSLGAIMANLERHGIADETIVLFISDNGGLSAHARGGEKHTHNAPLRSGKGSAYEGGVRVPLIVRWPHVVRQGAVSHAPVISEDIFPTVLRMAGVRTAVANAAIRAGDGVDMAPLLRQSDSSSRDRALLWHYPHVWGVPGPGIEPYSAVRVGAWKLIYFHADRRVELYNVAEDISEAHDLAAAEPAVVRRLRQRLRRELTQAHAQMSIEKATGQPAPMP